MTSVNEIAYLQKCIRLWTGQPASTLQTVVDAASRELNRMTDDCYNCGGEGFIDGDCTCGEDCCCCLEPDEPVCDICEGKGHLK